MNKLIDIQNEYKFNTDKGSPHTYLEKYDELFRKFKDEKINVLEIGALYGESLKLWSKYFTNGMIYGIDIFTRVSIDVVERNLSGFDNIFLAGVDSHNDDDISVKSRDAFFNDIGDTMFDIIIDDGHHGSNSQVTTFNNFIPVLNKGGIYIVEDIQMWDGNYEYVVNNIENLEIFDDNEGRALKDNTLGIYRNE